MRLTWKLTHLLVWTFGLLSLHQSDLACAQCLSPDYGWTRVIGGPGEDHSSTIAVDGQGNIFIGGRFANAVDFDPGPGTDLHTSNGREDIFVTKFSAAGSYLWTRTFGGAVSDIAYDLAVDLAGNVFVTGSFQSQVDFDPSGGTDNHTADGAYEDVFVTKLNGDGSYAWSKTIGAAGSDQARSIAVGSAGNIFITGSFRYVVDFDSSGNVDQHTSNGGYDVFVIKFAPDGSHVWSRTFGGTTSDWGMALAADASGNVFITGGYTSEVDFDPGSGIDLHPDNGTFVMKLGGDGSYGWTRTFGQRSYGGNDDSLGCGVAIDAQGNPIVTGYFLGTVDFDPGVGQNLHTPSGRNDVYVTKMHSDGSYAWTTTFGSWNFDNANDIAIGSNGQILVTGYYSQCPYFDTTHSQDLQCSKGWRDIFLTQLNADGSYGWTRTIGGTGFDDAGHAVATAPNGDVLFTGRFESTTVDFNFGSEPDERQSNGAFDLFVTKLSCSDGS